MDPEKHIILTKAKAIADEWITEMRLQHVLDKIPQKDGAFDVSQTGTIIKAMQEDVVREATGEIVESREALSAIAARTALLFKAYLKQQMMANVDSILGPLGLFVDKEKVAELDKNLET